MFINIFWPLSSYEYFCSLLSFVLGHVLDQETLLSWKLFLIFNLHTTRWITGTLVVNQLQHHLQNKHQAIELAKLEIRNPRVL